MNLRDCKFPDITQLSLTVQNSDNLPSIDKAYISSNSSWYQGGSLALPIPLYVCKDRTDDLVNQMLDIKCKYNGRFTVATIQITSVNAAQKTAVGIFKDINSSSCSSG